MASEMNDEHRPHHTGLTMQCPVSCLGLHTVADLVTLLAKATRTALLDEPASPRASQLRTRDEHTPQCPISCLRLPVRITNALRSGSRRVYGIGEPETVGDLLTMFHNDQLGKVDNIGPRSINEIQTALITAGFNLRPCEPPQQHNNTNDP